MSAVSESHMSPTPTLSSLHSCMDGALDLSARCPTPKRVIVVGGGSQGITSAYWLGRAGHQVTVIERGTPDSIGAAASYTGLLQVSSGFAPMLARPSAFSAFKVSWCPYTDYIHPSIRVGIFDSDVGKFLRVAMVPYSVRSQFLETQRRLHGFALWNNWLLSKLMGEWNTNNKTILSKQTNKNGITTSPTPSFLPSSPLTPVIQSSLAIAFDDRSWQDVRVDLDTELYLHDAHALPTSKFKLPPPVQSSETGCTQRFTQLTDLQLVSRVPSLKAKEFQLAGGVIFQDECAVDNIAILNKMKKESVDKFGVKYMYDTEVIQFNEGANQSEESNALVPATATANAAATASTTPLPPSSIASVQTSNGVVAGDAFLLCAGSDSKRLIRASQLSTVKSAIPTFTTRTHHLTFPPPHTQTVDEPSQNILPISVVLPESHTCITPFPNEIRVSFGDDINTLEDLSTTAVPAGTKLSSSAGQTKIDPTRLKRLVDDLHSVYPSVTRDVISQNGATIPHVSLRTWTLDNKPLLGRYHPSMKNLFINNGSGNLGWSHAIAAGKHVADIIGDVEPFIDPTPFEPNRFNQQ